MTNVGEATASDDGLGGDPTDSAHGETAIHELRDLLLLKLLRVLGGEPVPGEVCLPVWGGPEGDRKKWV